MKAIIVLFFYPTLFYLYIQLVVFLAHDDLCNMEMSVLHVFLCAARQSESHSDDMLVSLAASAETLLGRDTSRHRSGFRVTLKRLQHMNGEHSL